MYGSRFMIVAERRVMYYWHSLANRFVTEFCNLVADLNLTDMGTGYKAFRTAVLAETPLRSDGFGFEPEITIKLGRRGARVYEVPVSYHGRTYEEGKKIRTRDAFAILGTILRFSFTGDLYKDPGARRCTRFPRRRASTAGWRIPSVLTCANGCSRSAPASEI